MKQVQTLPIESVKQNTGQIAGLPSNPRQWKQEDIDRIAKSLNETPELFDARPLIVYPHNGEYIIMGGNLRYEGAKKNGMQIVPVHILPEDMDVEKLKEIVLKDNGSFGEWDFDALANEWDDLPLADWGIPAWKVGSVDMDAVDALFEESNKPKKEEELTLTITIPKLYEDNIEDIESAVKVTLEEWIGCTVK
jgi:hypothetical protein